MEVDVANAASVNAGVVEAIEKAGGIDAVVNNAGFEVQSSVAMLDERNAAITPAIAAIDTETTIGIASPPTSRTPAVVVRGLRHLVTADDGPGVKKSKESTEKYIDLRPEAPEFEDLPPAPPNPLDETMPADEQPIIILQADEGPYPERYDDAATQGIRDLLGLGLCFGLGFFRFRFPSATPVSRAA